MLATHRKVFHQTRAGETFEVLRTGEDTAGEFVEYEWTLNATPFGGLRPEHDEPPISQRRLHSHPFQTETIHVLAGELTVLVGNDEVRLRQGDTLTVPPGTPHRCLPTAHAARSRVVLHPALDSDLMLAAMGETDADQTTTYAESHGGAYADPLNDTLPPGLYLLWPERPTLN